MSKLNSVTLNSATLGSGTATTGYGGNVVNFSGTISFEVVFSLNSGGIKQRKFSLVSRQQLNAFIGERRFNRMTAAFNGTPRIIGVLGYRVRSQVTLDGPLTSGLVGYLNCRARKVFRIDAPLVMVLHTVNNGTDLSTTPAPSDRVSRVSAMDRTSYSRRR